MSRQILLPVLATGKDFNLTHTTQKPTQGHGTASYDSRAEASASHLLATHGIVRDESGLLPTTFRDADGRQFAAKPDFIHPPTGIYFEFKDSFLNGTKTKTTAERQHQSSRSKSPGYKDLKFSWSNSAVKLALVQEGMADAGRALIALFWHEPDQKTIGRMNRQGIFWTVYDSPSWRSLLGFLKMRSHGIPVTLSFTNGAGSVAHTFG